MATRLALSTSFCNSYTIGRPHSQSSAQALVTFSVTAFIEKCRWSVAWHFPIPGVPQSCSNYRGEERGKNSTLCFIFLKVFADGAHVSHIFPKTEHLLLNDFDRPDIDCPASLESDSCPQISLYIKSITRFHRTTTFLFVLRFVKYRSQCAYFLAA